MEKDLDLLDKMWSFVREWQGYYNSWKDGAFTDIKVLRCSHAVPCVHTALSLGLSQHAAAPGLGPDEEPA